MKKLQQCQHCVMVICKDDTTCPSCGEAVKIDTPEAASGCYEPEIKEESVSEKFNDDLVMDIVTNFIWLAVGFVLGSMF